MGLLEQHPEEGPQPALPDGLRMQGEAVPAFLLARLLQRRGETGHEQQQQQLTGSRASELRSAWILLS